MTTTSRAVCPNRISMIDLDQIMPPRNLSMDPWEMHSMYESSERRSRVIDVISSEFAHALTEALFKKARK